MDLENTENIIRIQKNIRGFLARKRLIGSNEVYYRMVLRKILRKLNNFEHFYDFNCDLGENKVVGIEDQAPGPGTSFSSDSKYSGFEVRRLDSEKFEEKEANFNNSAKLTGENQRIEDENVKIDIKNGINLNIGESFEGNSPGLNFILEADKKIVINIEEIYEDYMPASISYIIIVDHFIERVEVPIRSKVLCDCFDLRFEGVEKFEVNFNKPCCDIAILEKAMNNEMLGKGLREEVVLNGIGSTFTTISKGFENLERFEEVSSNLSYSSSHSEISGRKKSDKQNFTGDNKYEIVKNTNKIELGISETQEKKQLLGQNSEEKSNKDRKTRNQLKNISKNFESSINPAHHTEVNNSENKTEINLKQNNEHNYLKESSSVPYLKSESPKEKLLKGKSKKHLKDLIKKSAPISSNSKNPSNIPKKLSILPEYSGSRHSPILKNPQISTNFPDSKAKQYKNLKVEVQILPFEYNFFNNLGHKREDSKKNDALEVNKYDLKHKIQKKVIDKFYPYEKWTQVLPKLKKPRVTYSSYKDYGFLSDHRGKKEIGSGKSGEYRMVSSGSEQNIVKFRRNLPKFSSYKIKLIENQVENIENKEKNEETEKTSTLKYKKGKINDLYNK